MLELRPITPEEVTDFFLSDPKLICLGMADDEMIILHETGQYPCENTNIEGVYDNEELIALNKFEYFTRNTINMHFYLKSSLHGSGKLDEIFKFMKTHYEQNTDLIKVLFMVPSVCESVHWVAQKYGFKQEGYITKCFTWRKQLTDIVIYSQELNRERNKCQSQH
jgi:hypothetical protein